MKHIKRKLFSGMLVLAMVFTILPLNKIEASAASYIPLTFTAEEANSSVTFAWNSGTGVQYSTNGSDWSDYTAGTPIMLTNAGDKVSFKGTNVETTLGNHFTMTGKIAASGDVTSLTNGIGGDVALGTRCYECMFHGCTNLRSAPALPSTSLGQCCYNGMFYGCTNLCSAPVLPATTLADNCYQYMFSGCTNLSSVPVLSALSLKEYCYQSMFEGCTSLIVTETSDPSEATWVFPAVEVSHWNDNMIAGLTAPGTLTEVAAGKNYKVSFVAPPAPPAPPATPVGSNYNKTIEETNSQLEAMAEKLEKGEKVENATVYLTAGDSLPLSIMKTLKACPGVTLDFRCTYKGEKLHFVLKGGEELVINENIPWYGPMCLKSAYGVAGEDKNAGEKQTATEKYVIQRGDTLYRIARQLGTSLSEILGKNPQIKDPNRIWTGQLLNY